MELPDRDEREDEATGLLLALLARFEGQLMDIAGDPPDRDEVPGEYWLRLQTELTDVLAGILALTFIASAAQHGVDSQQQAAEASVGWSVATALQLALGITNTSRRMLNRGDDVDDIFGVDRAEGLAIDAITSGQTAGGEWAIALRDGLSPDDLWIAVLDERTCPICSPLHGTKRSEWGMSFPSGPPAHPKCRCAISYDLLSGTN